MKKLILTLAALIAFALPCFAQRTPMLNAEVQFFDKNGKPLASGKLWSYVAGTTTLKPTYSSSTGAANANPLILDSSGRGEVWLDSTTSYKFILKDRNDVQIWTVDNITDWGGYLYTGTTALSGDVSGAYDAVVVSSLQGISVSTTDPTADQFLSYTSNAWTPTTLYLDGSATLDFGNTSAQTSTDLTITVTGAATGDTVSLGLPASPNANGCFTAWVSATNTVTVRFNNYSSGAIDPASASYTVRVHK